MESKASGFIPLPKSLTSNLTLSSSKLTSILAFELPEAFDRDAKNFSEPFVRVKDRAGRIERRGAVVHSLYEQSVRMVRSLGHQNLVALASLRDERFDSAPLDLLDDFVGLTPASGFLK
jgi:hypothetical protein